MARAKKARRNGKRLRPTLLDVLDTGVERNIYCRREDLSNEASVEQFFISRLLSDLGYRNGQIKPKTSIDSLTVAQGRKRTKYKPDYALVLKGMTRVVIDAKAPTESLDDWTEQCSGYCLALNRQQSTNPVRFFILSNGLETRLYAWDQEQPLVTLAFEDFTWGNPFYEQFKSLVAPSAILDPPALSQPIVQAADFEFTRPTAERARQLFSICHRVIWKSEVCSPAFAFMEFVKVMFVKLWEDKKLRESSTARPYFSDGNDTTKLPGSSVIFSVKWVQEREREGAVNPIDTILFETLREDIEKSIELRKKKRLFDKGERIKLRPDTVKDVVERLQHFDMFGIDEDLNGRLFETFLSATMRGRELGQFFTPRSITKLMTRLAGLRADRRHQYKVIDGCCGSGGFLIEALTVMRDQIRKNSSLAQSEREALLDAVCNECIYGIDYGKDPPLARIARINMYLHGDGGSRIYYADGLDKKLDSSHEKEPEIIRNIKELRDSFNEPTLFDVVLTNPPFSMTKSLKNETERDILEQYVLARAKDNSARLRSSLRSSVMFIERYADLLRPGGKLITVIDESILVGPEYGFVRGYIRDNFLLRAVISLHGDAFQRSGSRIKTSILLLEKKRKPLDPQPPCFTYFSTRLGVDDLTPRASDSDIRIARKRASEEIADIVSGYEDYLAGRPHPGVIPADRFTNTFDLKSCVPLFGRMAGEWRAKGIEVKKFADCVTPVVDEVNPQLTPDQEFTLVKVGYDGRCRAEAKKSGGAIKSNKMYRLRTGQLVFSIIRAVNGAIGVVPKELDGAVVSESYTVFDAGSPKDTAYLWGVLRSHEVRADIQSVATGASRYYAYWPDVGAVLLPWLDTDKREAVGAKIIATWDLERKLRMERQQAAQLIADLGVESEASIQRWEASKPPK